MNYLTLIIVLIAHIYRDIAMSTTGSQPTHIPEETYCQLFQGHC